MRLQAGGAQIEGTLAFYRDPANGNWILFYVDPVGNFIQSGYYKKANFGTGQLSRNADRVDFGGEIAFRSPGGTTHTTTDVGSGQFSNAGYGNTAYQRNLKYMNLSGVIQNVVYSGIGVTKSGCYNVTDATSATLGTSFYFGGPGYIIPSCP
ncbi:MAG: neprosin family prolyl endopeptidase [Methylococcales bacterium]